MTNTIIISGNLTVKINKIKKQTGEEILLFDSPAATHSLIEQNFTDGFGMFVSPIILGQGIPLFKNIKDRINLKRMPTT